MWSGQARSECRGSQPWLGGLIQTIFWSCSELGNTGLPFTLDKVLVIQHKLIFKVEIFLDEKPISSVTVPSEITTFEFSGISLKTKYIISLACIFSSNTTYQCGSVSMSTNPPDMMFGNTIYTQLVVARTWPDSQAECLAGQGHLVSLGNMTEEKMILGRVSMSDIWTGGNICQDSPGRILIMILTFLTILAMCSSSAQYVDRREPEHRD